MRRIVVFCIVATVLAAMTSCGTAKKLEQLPTQEEELTQRWAGKEYQDIVQSYGEPDRIEMDGDDGSILVYEEQAPVSERVPQVPTTVTDRNHEREMYFFLNPEGYCYLVSTNRSVPGNDTEKHGLKKPLIVVGVIAGIALTVPIISLIRNTDFSDWRSQFEFY